VRQPSTASCSFSKPTAVIGGHHRQAQLLGHPGGDPLVTAAAQGGRAGLVDDAAAAAAEYQHLDKLVEDDVVGDAPSVAAQRVVDLAGGQQRGDLDPQRSRMDDGRAGTRPPCDRRM
jgi:hypothetical protein